MSWCRIRIYQTAGRSPVIVCSQESPNQGVSISEACDKLAGQVLNQHFPWLLGEEASVSWIEHYGYRQSESAGYEFALVGFESWLPRVGRWPVERWFYIALGRPLRRPLDRAQVEELIDEGLYT